MVIENLIFSASINLESLSDTIYDSFRSMVEIINATNKTDADKISLFEEYMSGLEKGFSIGSMDHISSYDILIVRYIYDSIMLKHNNKQITANKAWSDLSDLLNV